MFSPNTSRSGKIQSSHLFLFSGDSLEMVIEEVRKLAALLQKLPWTQTVAEFSSKAKTPAIKDPHRMAVVANDSDSLSRKLERILRDFEKRGTLSASLRAGVYYGTSRINGKVAFLYPGQGVQFPNMLLDLSQQSTAIEKWITNLDSAYKGVATCSPSSLLEVSGECSEEEYHAAAIALLRSEITLGAVIGASLALTEILAELGLEPDVVAGQSAGELTALIASGGLAAKDAKGFQELCRELQRKIIDLELAGKIPRGKVLSIAGIEVEALEKIIQTLNSSVELCLVNCPNQMILFGSQKDIQEAATVLSDMGVICQTLPFQQTFHNEGFRETAEAFAEVLADFGLASPKIPLFSSIDGERYPADPSEVLKRATQQWTKQVNFPLLVRSLYEQGVRYFIDVGPSNNLSSYLKDILGPDPGIVIANASSQRAGGVEALQQLLGALFAAGRDAHFSGIQQPEITVTQLRQRAPINRKPAKLAPLPESTFENQWPFIGQIIEHRSDFLKTRRILSFERDSFLRDHTLTRGLSNYREDLIPLAVQPFTVSAEVVAEAAAYLLHRQHAGLVVQELRDLRGHRWVSLDRDTCDLQIEARLLEADTHRNVFTVKVDLFEEAGSITTVERLHLFEGTAVLAREFPAAPEPMRFEISPATHSLFDPELLYSDGTPPADVEIANRCPGFFLGDTFQPIKRIRRWDLHGAEFDLEVLDRSDFFSTISSPQFQTDPVLADALGQMIAFAARQQLGRSYNFFPVQVKLLRQFCAVPEPGSTCVGRAKIHYSTATSAERIEPQLKVIDYDGAVVTTAPLKEAAHIGHSMDRACIKLDPEEIFLVGEIELLDHNGQLILRAEGWLDRPFAIPNRASLARHYPLHEYLSLPVAEGSGTISRFIDASTFGAWEASGGVWTRNMVHMSCIESERSHWYSLANNREEQLSWLMRLIAIKDAARVWALDTMNIRLSAVDITAKEIADDLFMVQSCIKPTIAFPTIAASLSGTKTVASLYTQDAIAGVELCSAADAEVDDSLKTNLLQRAAARLCTNSNNRFAVVAHKDDFRSALLSDGQQLFVGCFEHFGDTALAICTNNQVEGVY